jgi:hypothetical protein
MTTQTPTSPPTTSPSASPSPSPGDAQARLAVAARELRAAQAIVLDPGCEDSLAATHLATAWEALALATWPEGQPHPLAPRPEDRAALSAALTEAIDEVLPALLAARGRSPFETLPWTVPHAVLERHCDALARILARHQAPGHAAQPWRRRVALGAAALVLALLALRPWQAESFGPWAGTYFKRADFTGASTARRDLDLRFDWGEKSPMDAVPTDRFSVRWDTCLDLPAAASVPFQLVSDDGSRLYIDGKLALDNWGRHTVEARGATIALTPGEHHLRVEYVEYVDEASVALLASLDGGPPAAIPRGMLRAPDTGDDDAAPCAVGD